MADHISSAPELESLLRSRWCPISRFLDVVANRSSFVVLREAFYGTTRFDDFSARAGISESIAAARLRSLVEGGLLERRPYQEPGERTRYEYHLTEAGREFFPVLAAMIDWSSRWRGPSPVRFQHAGCNALVHGALRCENGHDLTIGDVELVRAAAMGTR